MEVIRDEKKKSWNMTDISRLWPGTANTDVSTRKNHRYDIAIDVDDMLDVYRISVGP